MGFTQILGRGLEVAFVVALVALVIGQLLGQPVLLGFVETESMRPMLEPNDGFVAVPTPLAGDIEPGDVIVFEAQELHGGGLTTHRVFAETDGGYITKGDANPFLDQSGDEPPVRDEQVVAEALQINGEVVVIPALGTAVTAVQEGVSGLQQSLSAMLGTSLFIGTHGLLNLILAGCILGYVLLTLGERRTRQRVRERDRVGGPSTRIIVATLVLLVLASTTAAMVVPAGSHPIAIESVPATSSDQGIRPGETETATIAVPNSGFVPVFVVFEPRTDGIEVEPNQLRVNSREFTNVTVSVVAPPGDGRVNRVVVEHRYLALLPISLLRALHYVHPWAPIIVIDALIGIPCYLLGIKLVGTGRIRTRLRTHRHTPLTRFRRLLR